VHGQTGGLVEHKWSVVGHPTASSPIAEGMAGIPYIQVGRLITMSPGVSAVVGRTGEIEAAGPQMTAIQLLGESLPSW
jgi:hypothetical protein